MSTTRIFHILPTKVVELDQLPQAAPLEGFYWVAFARSALKDDISPLQQTVQHVTGLQVVDLHVTDLLSAQLPSHFDYTNDYDILVFRRLSNQEQANTSEIFPSIQPAPNPRVMPDLGLAHLPFISRRLRTMQQSQAAHAAGVEASQIIDTDAVGFALFEQLLVSVHADGCGAREATIQRLQSYGQASPAAAAVRAASDKGASLITAGGARAPTSSAELMLRMVNSMVDAYLNLRRELTRQLDHWQAMLLNPSVRFNDWSSLLLARNALHHLEEMCEDQRSAIADWIVVLEGWPVPATKPARREHELLMVRSRDVLEHIERVAHHVRRMEQSAETAVQIHFNIQGNRTNDIMRALTAITALFLPLNLIAGIFGMNFESIPGLKLDNGFWYSLAGMAAIALALLLYFGKNGYFLPDSGKRSR